MIISDPKSVCDVLAKRDAEMMRSFDYVASLLKLDVEGPRTGPFASACYAKAVSYLSRKDASAARSTLGILEKTDWIKNDGCIVWEGDELPKEIWPILREMFDTDPHKPFTPKPAQPNSVVQFTSDYLAALDLLQRHYPAASTEIGHLLPFVFLAEPGSANPSDGFGGASTFFCPGAAMVNVARKRNIAQVIEVLVHEASHLLLFAQAGSGGLSQNDPTQTYQSPLRNDPRPMEGIFHAVFVCCRVHHVLKHIRYQSDLPVALHADFEHELRNVEQSGVAGFETLERYCKPTDVGRMIMSEVQTYLKSQISRH